MFSSNLKSFIMMNIYLLIIIDIVMILLIYFILFKSKRMDKKYKAQKVAISDQIIQYIQTGDRIEEVKKAIKDNFRKQVAIDIMIEYSEKNEVDISEKFIELELDNAMIQKLQQKMDIKYLRKLAFMRSRRAYSFLMKTALSDDFDLSYLCFIGLSMIELPNRKKEEAIQALVNANIAIDRKIEVISQFKVSFDEFFKLLKKQTSSEGKVIFLRNLIDKEQLKTQDYSDSLLEYFKDDKEVRVAAVLAICSSRNDKYIDFLSKLYEMEESWEVRVSIAKGLSHFSYSLTKDLLQKMTRDKEWWVRYNAIKTIVSMGSEGLFTLVELSLNEDKNIADLAYYFLNANQEVYNTVKTVEV